MLRELLVAFLFEVSFSLVSKFDIYPPGEHIAD